MSRSFSENRLSSRGRPRHSTLSVEKPLFYKASASGSMSSGHSGARGVSILQHLKRAPGANQPQSARGTLSSKASSPLIPGRKNFGWRHSPHTGRTVSPPSYGSFDSLRLGGAQVSGESPSNLERTPAGENPQSSGGLDGGGHDLVLTPMGSRLDGVGNGEWCDEWSDAGAQRIGGRRE